MSTAPNARTADEEPVEKWASASLRIFSHRDSDEVTGLLGAPASWTSPPPLSEDARQWKCVWVWTSELPDDAQVSDLVDDVLTHFEDKVDVLRELSKTDLVQLFIGFGASNGQGGFTLGHGDLDRLTDSGMELSLDLYPPGPIASKTT